MNAADSALRAKLYEENRKLRESNDELVEAAKGMLAHMGYVNAEGEWTIRPDHPLSVPAKRGREGRRR